MYTPQNYQTNRIINRQNQVKYEDIPPPQPLETFELTPNCMNICFMLPFPFFCLGCCTSQTAKFRFDNNNRILHIKSYCGYCFWFGDKIDIPFDNIVDVDVRMMPGCYVNDQQAFKVYLLYRGGEIELSGSIMPVQAMDIDRHVRSMLLRCGIAAGQRPSNMPNFLFYPIISLY